MRISCDQFIANLKQEDCRSSHNSVNVAIKVGLEDWEIWFYYLTGEEILFFFLYKAFT
jgi:hypothetical protein